MDVHGEAPYQEEDGNDDDLKKLRGMFSGPEDVDVFHHQ